MSAPAPAAARTSSAVLLVSCYELGRQPLGVASPLASLARAGVDADVLDLAVEPLDPAKVAAARFVGIATPMHTALRVGMEAARRIREMAPAAHVSFFGLYAHLNADRLLGRAPSSEVATEADAEAGASAAPPGEPALADSVIAGEVEEALVALVLALAAGGDPATVEGVSTRERRAAPVLARIPLAPPRRDRLPPLERYSPLLDGDKARLAGAIEATRGCLHLCRHCPLVPIYAGRLFVVPAEVVLADARAQVAAGATHLTFADPDFLNAPTHALRIARALHAEHPHVTFDVTAKVSHLLRHRALLPELKTLGAAFVVTALEARSDRVLQALDKGHTAADIDLLLDLLDEATLPVRPSFVPFTPWSTLDDVVDLLDWIEARGLDDTVDPVQMSIRLLVPPGSRLLELPAGTGFPGPLDPDLLGHRWTHEDPRMDALARAFATRVALAANRAEDPGATFAALRAMAAKVSGRAPAAETRPRDAFVAPQRERPPRLAEAWFC